MSEQRVGPVNAGLDRAAAEVLATVDGMSNVGNDDVDALPRGRGGGGPPARVVCNEDDASLVSNISTPCAAAAPLPPTNCSRPAPALESSSATAPDHHDRLRVVHRIRLSSIRHNYDCVEGAAARQHCSVIAVVKADAYGHGAAETAMHLVDSCGCDAFAVASLEEAIALRRALTGMSKRGAAGNPDRTDAMTKKGGGASAASGVAHSQVQSTVSSAAAPSSAATTTATATSAAATATATATTVGGDGSNRIRIMVLGPPVGYPRCFDAYHHNNIEAMITGPKVAAALMEWVCDAELRKRAEIESSAAESKEEAAAAGATAAGPGSRHSSGNATPAMASSVTLSNVQGNELLREVQAILTKQKAPPPSAAQPPQPQPPGASSQSAKAAAATVSGAPPKKAPMPMAPPAKLFQGISEAAKESRNRAAAAEAVAANAADESSSRGVQSLGNAATTTNGAGTSKPRAATVVVRKRLRWHALVDSGMGRLGFKPEDVVVVETPGDGKDAPDMESCGTASTISSTAPEDETGKKSDGDCGGDHVDPVSVIKMLHDAEVHDNAPIEFYGMCTHMAEATEGSSYTKKQMSKFVTLIEAVRNAGILIHTISTDNSSALLTPSLTHFTSDRSKILNQNLQDTRGYVRVGGAIYGQRPAFPQLRTVSTLLAWVRHVATHKEGDSVGYDRAYVAERDVRIATVTIGFADGYPRELGNGVGRVCIRGHAFPVAGNVCMDMIMVDLGPANDPDCPGASVEVGDEVVLWGPHTDEDDHAVGGDGSNEVVKLKDLAAALKTTQSALTCGLDKLRVSRQYI